MSENDPAELADRRSQEADELQEQSERLGDEVRDARQDWERKRTDENVPGAPPPERGDDEGRDSPADGAESG